MPKFIHDDFLLETDEARELYHGYARDLPIIDYHGHLPIADIASDRRFANLTQIWLAGDHYKWRAMRTWGVDERLITGDAGDAEKFAAWAEVVPHTLRNPLYHWTHLELTRYFGIEDLLDARNAAEVYAAGNAALARPEFSAVGLLKRMRVEVLCTTDDPTDDLAHHRAYRERGGDGPAVYPAWRPDRALRIEDPAAFNAWVDRLAQAAGTEIDRFERLLEALEKRQQVFHAAGCRLADHGIAIVPVADYTAREVAAVFAKVRGGGNPAPEEAARFQAALLLELCRINHALGWTQQLHFGVLRNVNARMFARLGPDAGFDSIGDFRHAAALARFLDSLDREEKLARTILYNGNPADNAVVATMLGNFQEGRKLQFGSAWWFLDQQEGIAAQLNDLSAMGLVATFVGMTTDSRSFLSFPRHEYFRRILCNLFGTDMHKGLIPADMDLVGGIVRDICYYNARRYFGFEPYAKDQH